MSKLMILVILCVVYIPLISAEELRSKADKVVPNLTKEKLLAVKLNKKDTEILQSMDNLGDQLDLIELDKQLSLPPEKLIELEKARVELESIELIDDDLLLDDGFDALDLEIELFEEVQEFNISPKNILGEILNIKNVSKNIIITKGAEIKGVGVEGKEEQVINKLDKSELINVDKELKLLIKDLEALSKESGDNNGF